MKIVETPSGTRVRIADTVWYPCTWKLILKEKQMAKGSALKKEMRASEELQAIVKEKKISRGQMMKKLWHYVKKHKLQNKDDKRMVDCDDKLSDLFKKVISKPRKFKMRGKTIRVPKGSIFMTEMGGALSKHLS